MRWSGLTKVIHDPLLFFALFVQAKCDKNAKIKQQQRRKRRVLLFLIIV